MFRETISLLEIRIPNDTKSFEFFHWEKTQRCSFVVYANLEAINVAATVCQLQLEAERGKWKAAPSKLWCCVSSFQKLVIFFCNIIPYALN